MVRVFVLSALLLGAGCPGCRPAPATTTRLPAASRPPTPAAPLQETRWVLRQLGSRLITVPSGGQEPYLLLRASGEAEGQGSCNRFRTTSSLSGTSKLVFSPLLSTRMACPALATEQDFTRALEATHAYRISGDTLRLYAAEPGPTALARLEAVYLR